MDGLARGEPIELALRVGGAAGAMNACHGLGTGGGDAIRAPVERVEGRPLPRTDGTDDPGATRYPTTRATHVTDTTHATDATDDET